MTIRLLMITLYCSISLAHAQQYKVKVHVLGHDGKPMQESHASLTKNAIDSQIEIPASSVQGNTFEFLVDTPDCILPFAPGYTIALLEVLSLSNRRR